MSKDFNKWNTKKKEIHCFDEERVFFYEREIWWARLGCNIGFEVDGKGEEFSRPVLILKKYNKYSFLAVPLTMSKKGNRYLVPVGVVDGKRAAASISQIRNIDSKRLVNKVGFISKRLFIEVKEKISQENLG